MPHRYITIEWNESSETDLAQYEIKLNDVTVQFQTAGNPNYRYRTPRLDPGEMSIVVIALDQTGNELSTVSELTYVIESVPPPVRSAILSQSGATNLSITLVEPLGWPT